MTKPNLFIAGAPRCGTTSIYNYLCKHPDIYGPNLKEPRFLCSDLMNISKNDTGLFSRMTVFDEDKYYTLYKDGEDKKYRMDGSPFYMYYEKSIKRMRDISTDSKVIVSIRDPVSRIESMYNMQWNRGLIKIGFDDYVNQIIVENEKPSGANAFYCEKLMMLSEVLGQDRFMIVLFDDMRKDAKKVITKINKFLDIENIIPSNIDRKFYSNSNLIKKGIIRGILTGKLAKKLYIILPRKIVNVLMQIFKLKSLYKEKDENLESKQKLLDYYMKDIIETETFTGFDLSSWKVI